MLTESTRKNLCRIVGLWDKKNKKTIISFVTVLCLIPENVYGRPLGNYARYPLGNYVALGAISVIHGAITVIN